MIILQLLSDHITVLEAAYCYRSTHTHTHNLHEMQQVHMSWHTDY